MILIIVVCRKERSCLFESMCSRLGDNGEVGNAHKYVDTQLICSLCPPNACGLNIDHTLVTTLPFIAG